MTKIIDENSFLRFLLQVSQIINKSRLKDKKFFNFNLDVNFSKNLAVAVSGGADSMALCFMLKEYLSCYKNIQITAITIDHQLRADSSIEAKKVHELLSENGIRHVIIPWVGVKPKSNVQEEARIARYNLLTNYCRKENIKYLFTAHHKNDQAENFIIRAEYGSKIYGLAGISKISEFNNISIIRPLLSFEKKDLQEFLRVRNINWVEDPSNLNLKFARVRARAILKNNPQLTDILVELTDNMSRAKESIEYAVNMLFNQIVQIFPQNYAVICISEFNHLPQEIRFRLLEKILTFLTSNYKIRGERIDNLLKKIMDYEDFGASTLAGCLIKKKKDKIIITLEYAVVNEYSFLSQEADSIIFLNSYYKLELLKEMQFKYGSVIVEKLKEKDWIEIKKFLNKDQLKIPKEAILTLPVVKTIEKLLAIPHINYYSDQYIKNLIRVIR
jgi:tRNA(Ile)-lysidine synthase